MFSIKLTDLENTHAKINTQRFFNFFEANDWLILSIFFKFLLAVIPVIKNIREITIPEDVINSQKELEQSNIVLPIFAKNIEKHIAIIVK